MVGYYNIYDATDATDAITALMSILSAPFDVKTKIEAEIREQANYISEINRLSEILYPHRNLPL